MTFESMSDRLSDARVWAAQILGGSQNSLVLPIAL
jgi:hypothetical protein